MAKQYKNNIFDVLKEIENKNKNVQNLHQTINER